MDIVKGNMGWIEVVVGPMFSGKSEELIRRLRRAEIARQRVQIFKPAIDERYAANEIISHSGLGIPSDNVTKAAEIMDKVQPRTEVIGRQRRLRPGPRQPALERPQALDLGVTGRARQQVGQHAFARWVVELAVVHPGRPISSARNPF